MLLLPERIARTSSAFDFRPIHAGCVLRCKRDDRSGLCARTLDAMITFSVFWGGVTCIDRMTTSGSFAMASSISFWALIFGAVCAVAAPIPDPTKSTANESAIGHFIGVP